MDKLAIIEKLIEQQNNEKAVKENQVYQVLMNAIDNSASEALNKQITEVASKLAEVEQQAPRYFTDAMANISKLANSINDTENRLKSEIEGLGTDGIRQELADKHNDFTKLLNATKTEITLIKKQIANVEIKHGKDGKTPVKGKDYFDGEPGKPGEDGNGITSAKLDGEDLVLTFTNGIKVNVGRVKGKAGNGQIGRSAYRHALDGGYTGTEEEFNILLANIGEGGGGGVALGETETTAYRGDRGKTAYDHSQSAHAPVDAEANVNADWNAVSGDAQILNKPSIPAAYTHPANHPPSIIAQDTTNRFVTDAEKTTWNSKQNTLVSGSNIRTVNGNSLLGSTDLVISGGGGSADPISLADRAVPSAPVSGITLFSRRRAGKSSLNVIGPSGLDSPLQNALYGNNVVMWLPSNGTTVSIAFGTPWTARNTTGAQATPARATTNFLTQMARATFSSTAATATASGIQSTQTVCVRGNANNVGGFFYFSRFGVETLSGTGQQIMVGLSTLNAVLAGEPSALTNSLALIKDSTDTEWFFLSRDASGTITKRATGLTVTAGVVLSLYMFCKPNDTKVTVRLVRENDGVVIMDDIEITATLPVNTTFLFAHAHLRNTGAAINALALNRIYVETDI